MYMVRSRKEKKVESYKDTELVHPHDVSIIKAPVSASVTSATVSASASDLNKSLDSLQDEWSTHFIRIEALLTL